MQLRFPDDLEAKKSSSLDATLKSIPQRKHSAGLGQKRFHTVPRVNQIDSSAPGTCANYNFSVEIVVAM